MQPFGRLDASTVRRRGDSVDARLEARFCEYAAVRQQSLLRTAYLLTGDLHAAEDLVQIALAKAYLSWSKLREPHAADAYVRRIMVNEHTSWWRRAWRQREHSTDVLPETAVDRQDPTEFDERDRMWALVQTLPPRQRAAVVLRYYEDMSEAETAQVLGCSVGTVKSQTSRAVATLRRRLTIGADTTTGGA
jgi:RNA polymerase sigma-70 factor (sigma-E family)